MFKFLRKYSVWILGVGGTMLLIAFLAPNVIQQLAQQAGYAGTTQATVGDNEGVGFEEWQQNLLESQVIDKMGIGIPGVGELESPEHWYLLSREADLAGLTPSVSAIAIDPQTLINISRQAGASPALVLDALAHLQGVQRLIQLYQRAGRFSDRRLQHAASDLLSTVVVETVVINATPEDNDSFSEEAMQAQFDAWADTTKGEGDYGFGYKLPDRFKVEWLQIPASSITQAAENSDEFSTREQRKYWRRNENDPRFPAIEGSIEIPEEVRTAYLEELSNQTRTVLSRNISEQLRAPRRGLDVTNGFIDLPANWDDNKVGLETIATNLQEEFGIVVPLQGSFSELLPVTDASSVAIIGNTLAINLGDVPVDFATLITSAKEFGGEGILQIQERVASPVLETLDGDLVIFRITDAAPSARPETIDEVKVHVEFDLGTIARWETLQAESGLIEQLARDKGLLAASIKYNSQVNNPQSVSLVETNVPGILDATSRRSLISQTLIQRISIGQQINDMASNIRGLDQPDASVIQIINDKTANMPIDKPIADLSVEERIFVIPSDENMAIVLVSVTGTTPASRELAKDLSGGSSAVLQTLLSFDELGGADEVVDTFSFDSLAARHNFKRGRASVEEETETSVN